MTAIAKLPTIHSQILNSIERLSDEELDELVSFLNYLEFKKDTIKRKGDSILDVLKRPRTQFAFKTAEEVDSYLQEERDSWE